jgi:hypothetical protein
MKSLHYIPSRQSTQHPRTHAKRLTTINRPKNSEVRDFLSLLSKLAYWRNEHQVLRYYYRDAA